MKNYWCEQCDHRWKAKDARECPKCQSIEIRTTMSEEEARKKGLLEYKEIVICSAIRMDDKYIIRGHRHSDCIRTMMGIPKYKESWAFGEDQGFVTSSNRYVNRIEGAKIQKEAGIKSKMPEGQEYLHGELYSEDLY